MYCHDENVIFEFAFIFDVNMLCSRELGKVTANGLRSLAFTHTKTSCFGQEIARISYRKVRSKQTKTSCFGVSVNTFCTRQVQSFFSFFLA